MISIRAYSLLLPIACCLTQTVVCAQDATKTTGASPALPAEVKPGAVVRKFQPLPWQAKNDTTFGAPVSGQVPAFLKPASTDPAAPAATTTAVAPPDIKADGTADPQVLPRTGPYETGYFGGLTPADPSTVGELHEKLDLTKSPEWAKDRIKMRYFRDNKEHFGDTDPGGFF